MLRTIERPFIRSPGRASVDSSRGKFTYEIPWYAGISKLTDSLVLDLAAPVHDPTNQTKIYDISGKGNDSTITGATWERLPSGLWVLNFDGSDDVVSISATNLGLTNSFAFELWARITGNGNILAIDSAGTIRTRLLQSGNNIAWAVQTPVAVTSNSTTTNLNKWYHIVGVYNGATQYILLNGVIEDSDAQTGSIGAGQTNLGAASNGGYTPMKAALVRIYNPAPVQSVFQTNYLRERHLFGV